MSTQEKIAQYRIDANQHLRFAVADIGSALFSENSKTFSDKWMAQFHPKVTKAELIPVLLLKGFYVKCGGNYIHVYVSKAVHDFINTL